MIGSTCLSLRRCLKLGVLVEDGEAGYSKLLEGGIISLQYADDTLLFLENNLEKASNLKWLLVCFEQMSDMKINYNKSDLLTVGLEEDQANEFVRLF